MESEQGRDIMRNYAAEVLVDIAFDTSAPNLGRHSAAQLDSYLSDSGNLQLLSMSVFRTSQGLDHRSSKLLESALSQFDGEASYLGDATARIRKFMKSAGREQAPAPETTRPFGYGAIDLGKKSDYGLAL